MEITKATTADIPKLCTLLATLFTQEVEFKSNRKAQAIGLNEIINTQSTGDVLVLRQSGEIIGMVNLLYTISTALGERVGILEDMVISPKGRGLGVGSKLLSYTLEFAKKNKCKRITLLTDCDNEGAHRFYQKHGFSRSSMTTFRISL